MSARKLYYEDCHLSRFTAHVTACARVPKGWEVTLDQTAFYPEGGGQACDLGTLGGVPVLDVRESRDEVIHLCGGPLEPGTEVAGEIDYDRRFDLMQQHTGEHIVSGIIHAKWGYHNVGFHMGAEMITIDFDGPIPAEALPEIEAEANEAIWRNIPLHIWYPAEDELPNVGYRTKRALPWPVRVVEVSGYDKCACCGVHVAATGEIGLIKLFSMVKFHEGVRMEMLCGKRALAFLSAAFEENRKVSQAFSARILETGEAAKRMNELLSAEKFRSVGLQRRIFGYLAESYENRGDVLHFEPGLDSGALRELADAVAARCGGMAAVFSGSDEAGYGYCLAARGGDLRAFGREMTQALSGRGGGKPEFQQGSVKAARARIEAFFAEKR